MDTETHESQPRRSGSFGGSISASSSRRRSLSLTFSLSQVNDDIESETVSEAGDIGDRIINSNRCSVSGRTSHFSFDVENGTVVPIQEDTSFGNISSPLSTDGAIQSGEGKKDEREAPWIFEYIKYLLCLAIFGILGVLARFYLQKLFGPQVIGATSDGNYMYLDLPSNMIGSFLMGWFGVVFKGDISKVSDQLAVGLTTGFLGSLTTFSGWNQKILELCVRGQWVFAVLAIIIGLFLASSSIAFGIETAKGFHLFLERSKIRPYFGCTTRFQACTSNKFSTFTLTLLLVLGLVWGTLIGLETKDFKTGGSEAELYLACLVGPFGVWLRWFLARFNGRGLGKDGKLKWVPFGTLAANVLAACVMAALATLKKVVKTQNCDTVANGIQLGLLGCLSTVSTFMAEFNAMRESTRSRRAYAYATITFLVSFFLGIFIYSVPVWAKGYN